MLAYLVAAGGGDATAAAVVGLLRRLLPCLNPLSGWRWRRPSLARTKGVWLSAVVAVAAGRDGDVAAAAVVDDVAAAAAGVVFFFGSCEGGRRRRLLFFLLLAWPAAGGQVRSSRYSPHLVSVGRPAHTHTESVILLRRDTWRPNRKQH